MENKEEKILSPDEWLKEFKPEIKLPDKKDLNKGDRDYCIGKLFGWNDCIDKIKELNGL